MIFVLDKQENSILNYQQILICANSDALTHALASII